MIRRRVAPLAAWGLAVWGCADPLVPVTPRTCDPGRGQVVASTSLGIITSQYDQKGHATAFTSNARYMNLSTVFQVRFGLLPDFEFGGQAPILFSIYTLPNTLAGRQSGGGIGDTSAWVKYRWWAEASWGSAVWAGVKWPTGKWEALDPGKQGTDRTGTGSQDVLLGVGLSHDVGGAFLHLNVSVALTGLKQTLDVPTGAWMEVDDGDLTTVVLGATVKLHPQVEMTIPLVLESAGRVRHNGTRVDGSEQQWVALRPSWEARLTPEMTLEPTLEFPFRGVNRQRAITMTVNVHYEF